MLGFGGILGPIVLIVQLTKQFSWIIVSIPCLNVMGSGRMTPGVGISQSDMLTQTSPHSVKP